MPAAIQGPKSVVSALVVAAGSGSRFGGGTPKQYRLLAGVPLIVRTLRILDACAAIDRMVLVVPAEDLSRLAASLLPGAGVVKPVLLAAGGLEHVADDVSLVAIHDAVRPLVSGACIAACVEEARRSGACTAALPAWDTLKRVEPDGSIRDTLPRDRVWLAQTPQVFRTDLIREAHAAARSSGWTGTDDAELVERIGARVRVVPGSRMNFKITTPDDLHLAEMLLSHAPASD
jgi:2-C-methyl-D-erythritol 4-phosphate cytidylyltransferase